MEEVETTEEADLTGPVEAEMETLQIIPTLGHLLASQIKVKIKAGGAPGTLTTHHRTHVDCIGNSDEELGHVPTATTARGETSRAPGPAMTGTSELLK